MNFPWWDTQSVALFDQILFLPPGMEKSSPVLENLSGAVAVEFCSGNGAWVIQKALENPSVYWLAVEKKLERAKKIWKRAKRLSAANVLVVCGSAEHLVNLVLPEEIISQAFINFPDPWPKRRHAKHRIVRDEFIAQLQKKMRPQGQIMFVTDHYPYIEEGISVFNKCMKPLLPAPYFAADPEGYGTSFFEDLWRSQNKTIHYTLYAND